MCLRVFIVALFEIINARYNLNVYQQGIKLLQSHTMDLYAAHRECTRIEEYEKVSVISLIKKKSKFRTVVE